jgi:hypothetical protein
MTVQCDKCGRFYDDAECWTLCPHGPLAFPLNDYCYKCDTLRSIHGRCRHQQEEDAAKQNQTK